MGHAFVKPKTNKNSILQNIHKKQIKIQLDLNQQIPLKNMQLINWSLDQVKSLYQGFQRISQSPMVDSFLFKKLMPIAKKNSEAIFFGLSNGDSKNCDIQNLFPFLKLYAYWFQGLIKLIKKILVLVFDLERKGNLNGNEFLMIFYSVVYGYCRLTNQALPKFEDLQKFAIATFFPGEDDYDEKQVNLRKFIEQYDGNSSVNTLFNRFQRGEWKNIREDPLIYSPSQFKKFTKEKSNTFYRILLKIYEKNDYQEVFLLEQDKQFRRQSRRDSCLRKILEQKYDYPQNEFNPQIKRTMSLRKVNSYTPSSIQKARNTVISSARETSGFKIKKVFSPSKIKPFEKKNIFLKGNLCSKNQVFEAINYFKTISDYEEKINIKDFFKKFEKNVFLKKQLSSIFRFLDYDKNGEITLFGYFKSLYPGLKQADILLLSKWYSQYKQIYEADTLEKNQVKVSKISQARILPFETYERIKEIFGVLDNGAKGYLNFEDIKKSYKQGFTTGELEELLKQYGDGKKIDMKGLCKMLVPAGWRIEGMDIS